MTYQPLHTAQFEVDDAYRITGLDDNFAELLGMSASELLGSRIIELVAAPDRPAVMRLAADLDRGAPGPITGTCSFVTRGGASRRVTLVVAPRPHSPGGALGTVICLQDPPGRHAAEESALERRREWLSTREDFAGRREALMAQRESLLAERETFVDSWERELDRRERVGRHAAGWHSADRPAEQHRDVPAGGPHDMPGGQRRDMPGDGPRGTSAAAVTREAGRVPTEERPPPTAQPAPSSPTGAATPSATQVDLLTHLVNGSRDGHVRPTRHLTGRPATRHPRPRGHRSTARTTPVQRDSLTGLDTRATLLAELAAIGTDTADFAVLLVDLDDFKSVNDTHGHEVGDEVLSYVAESLRSSVRPDDLIVRYGGDEFVVLCADRAAAPVVAERIVAQLAMPLQTSAGLVTITASVGIGDGTVAAEHAEDLLGRADAAMYWAKHLGKNRYFVYDAELHAKVIADRHIEGLLHDAASEGRLVLRYQPIVNISGAIIGMEVVTRLLDHDGSMLMPDDFIPVAERVGAICAIDSWVLTEACRTSAQIQQMVSLPLIVSVNVSVPLLTHDRFVDRVVEALDEAGLSPSSLMLELSESALLHADTAEIGKLSTLRERGVRVAVDGFGLGYSPLAFLRRLPLTHVKMSRPCVMAVLDDERDAAMIEALTWLVDQLGLTWVAEGIETEAQWQAIRQYGPGCGQGFLFAQPLSEPQLITALTADGIGRGSAQQPSSVSS